MVSNFQIAESVVAIILCIFVENGINYGTWLGEVSN